MAFPVTLNGRTYTLADFAGQNYVDGLPDAFEDFVTQAGDIYNSTSTSSVAIGSGSKSFTIADSGKPYQPGTPLRIADAAAPSTNFMDCIVTSYSGTSLVVDSIGYAGSGTKSSWTINIGGTKTADGTIVTDSGSFSGSVTIDGDLIVDTDTLFVDASTNRVGFGTSTPDVEMELSNSSGNARFQLTASTTLDSSIRFGDTDDNDVGQILYDHAADFMSFRVNASEAMRIDDSGNVGIGTASPSEALDVTGNIFASGRIRSKDGTTGDVGIGFGTDHNVGFIRPASDTLGIVTGSTERIRVTATGLVGIGTASPDTLMQVQGSADGVPLFAVSGNQGSARGLTIGTATENSVGQSGVDLTAPNARGVFTFYQAGNKLYRAGATTGIDGHAEHIWYTQSGTERMRITNAGNVGIGTSSPASITHIAKDSSTVWSSSYTGTSSFTPYDHELVIDNSQDDVAGSFSGIFFKAGETTNLIGVNAARIAAIREAAFNTALAFSVRSLANSNALAEAMRIDSSGNVGIGTDSPSSKLTAYENSASACQLSIGNTEGTFNLRADGNAGILYANTIRFLNSAGSTEYARFNTSGNLGIGTASPAAELHVSGDAIVSGDVGIGYTSNADGIKLDVDGSANFTEGVRLNAYFSASAWRWREAGRSALWISNGSDTIAFSGAPATGSSADGSTTASQLVFLEYDALNQKLLSRAIRDDTTASAANVFINSSTGAMQRSTSSLRYKTDIEDAAWTGEQIDALRPVTYKGINDGDRVFGGLIAEEVHAAGLTEFVEYNEDGQPDALLYGHMVSLLLKEIQSLRARVADLEAKNG